MRRRFFLSNFTHLLLVSLVPLMLFSALYLFITIPEQRRNANEQMLNNLTLMQENFALLLNDATKAMNLMESTGNIGAVRRLFQQRDLNYSEYVSYKSLAAQLAAIVNSRDYIDSIYLYYKNSSGAYLSSQGRLYTAEDAPDKEWLSYLTGSNSRRIVRRSVPIPSLPPSDYLTTIEENNQLCAVAVNINISYFKRIFSSLNLRPEETLMISDGENLLLSNNADAQPLFASLQLSGSEDPAAQRGNNVVVRSHSDALNLDFISVMPVNTAYSASNRFVSIFLSAALVCMVFSFVSSLLYASRTARRLYSVMDLLEAASHNEELPDIRNPHNDVYGYIMTNIVKAYVQNYHLKSQLDERRLQTVSMELSALQYQINPHFLSNTLQIIDFEVLRAAGKPCRANQMIEQLSAFLQHSLKSPNQDVTIAQEVEATQLYASLMQVRFSNCLRFEWNVDPSLLSQPIPKLILQPIIENAIQHGRTEATSMLTVRLQIQRQGNTLCIHIVNDGPGVSEARLREIRQAVEEAQSIAGPHIGLPNVIRRLRLRFNDDFRYEIENPPEGGFSVGFFIPMS